MIRVNTVLTPREDAAGVPFDHPMLVVWAEPALDRLFLINLRGKPRKPVRYPYSTVRAWVDQQALMLGKLLPPDEYRQSDAQIPPRSREIRDEHFEAIRPIISDLQAFLLGTHGAGAIAKRAEELGKSRQQIYDWIYQYLRGGQSLFALLPRYYRSKTENRITQNGSGRKRGRPRKNSPFQGKNVDAQDRENIKHILKRHYYRYKGLSLTRCYDILLRECYCESLDYSAADHLPKVRLLTPDEYPSWDQFFYHAKKILNACYPKAGRVRKGDTNYDKDYAGRSGNPIRADGPGQIYQLDATEHDIDLVSPLVAGRLLRIGRLTLYKVVDVFSGALVGMHYTLAPPSWAAARIALFNAFRSKVDFCREWGLTIKHEDWPVEGICEVVFVDNYELQNQISEPGIQDGLYSVRFGRAYRGDDKGLVENAMKRANAVVSDLPGFIRKHSHGERDVSRDRARMEACLTPRELGKVLIAEILYRNNIAAVPESYLSREMVEDGVRPVSRDIFRWGMRNSPYLRHCDEAQIYLRMMEKGSASIRKKGLYFKGVYYRCDWTRVRGFHDQREHSNRAKKVEIRFHRHCADFILVATDEGLQPAWLMEQRFEKATWDEIEARLNDEAQWRAAHAPVQAEGRASVDQAKEDLVSQARSEQKKLTKAQIRSQPISDNRAPLLEQEQRADADRAREFAGQVYGVEGTKAAPTAADPQGSQQKPIAPPADRRDDDFDDALDQL